MLRLVLALLAPLALLLASCATTYTGPFAHEVSPDLYTIAFENDEVRVLVANYAPGDESNTFMTPPSLLIFVSDASRWKETYPDGSSFEFPDPTPAG